MKFQLSEMVCKLIVFLFVLIVSSNRRLIFLLKFSKVFHRYLPHQTVSMQVLNGPNNLLFVSLNSSSFSPITNWWRGFKIEMLFYALISDKKKTARNRQRQWGGKIDQRHESWSITENARDCHYPCLSAGNEPASSNNNNMPFDKYYWKSTSKDIGLKIGSCWKDLIGMSIELDLERTKHSISHKNIHYTLLINVAKRSRISALLEVNHHFRKSFESCSECDYAATTFLCQQAKWERINCQKNCSSP